MDIYLISTANPIKITKFLNLMYSIASETIFLAKEYLDMLFFSKTKPINDEIVILTNTI